MKSKVFIGSSVEGLNVAYAIQQNLKHNAESTVWDQGVFDLSKTSIESLEAVLQKMDFGIFVFSPDDVSVIRDNHTKTVRDNVLFELGLFIGKLGRNRVFFVLPEGCELHIATDLTGITPGTYETERNDSSLQAATGAVCNQIRNQIKRIGSLHDNTDGDEASEDSNRTESNQNEWLEYLINNQLFEAKEKLEEIISKKASDNTQQDKAWLLFIKLKLDQKGAVEEFKKFATSTISEVDIQDLLSQMLMWEGYYDVAIELLQEAIKANEDSCQLTVALANIYETDGQHQEALTLLNESEPKLNPEIAIALSKYYEEGSDEAYETLRTCYDQNPNNKDLVFQLARCLQEKNRNSEALYLFNFLVLNHPDEATYWAYLSNTCVSLDLNNKALVTCQKARDLSGAKQSWILNNIGNILNNRGLFDEAITWLEKGLEIDSHSEYAHERLSGAIKGKEEQETAYLDLVKMGRSLLRANEKELRGAANLIPR